MTTRLTWPLRGSHAHLCVAVHGALGSGANRVAAAPRDLPARVENCPFPLVIWQEMTLLPPPAGFDFLNLSLSVFYLFLTF